MGINQNAGNYAGSTLLGARTVIERLELARTLCVYGFTLFILLVPALCYSEL